VSDQKTDLAPFEAELRRAKGLDTLHLELERKRVRDVLGTPEGREALRREMGYNFQFVDDALADGRPLISLLVPTRAAPKPETNRSVSEMLDASKSHCIVTPCPGVSSSVVHWARNDLIINLRKSGKPADYVLLMDDDMVPPTDALIKLLAHDVDLVAGACTVRTDPPKPNFRVWAPELRSYRTAFEWKPNSAGLIEVDAVGAAFMLVKTTVLDKVGEYYLSCRYEREHLGMSEEVAKRCEFGRRDHAARTGNEWWFEFLKHPWGDGEYGEDLSFCFKAKECGVQAHVDTTVCPGHIGSYAYGMEDFYSYRQEVIARQPDKVREVIQ
jgi:hypothetical protein